MSKKKMIVQSLMGQLRGMGADAPHFENLVHDYMNLFDVKNKLLSDIRKRGVVFEDVSSTGVVMKKNNPSVKEVVGVSRQMLTILRELGLRTDTVHSGSEDSCDL